MGDENDTVERTNLRRGTGRSERPLRSETSGGPQNLDRRALQRLAGKGDTGVERDGRIGRQLLEPRLDPDSPARVRRFLMGQYSPFP